MPTAPSVRVPGPVVLIGTGGLRWDDVGDSTPALYALFGESASADLAARSVRETTCPVDGWLAVSAGRRAADEPAAAGGPQCRVPTVPDALARTGVGGSDGTGTSPTAGAGTSPALGTAVNVPRWPVYLAQAAAGSFDARPGLLGDTLAAAGRTVAAVGPGALIAAADGSGRVAHGWPGLPAGP